MIRATITRHVEAHADAVFATLVDVTRLPEWNRAIRQVLEEPDVMAEGAEWVVEMSVLGRRWPSRSRVDLIDPLARRFRHTSQTDDGNPSRSTWTWTVTESGAGCDVTVELTLDPKTFWRRVLLSHVRHHQLMRSEVPGSLAALGDAVRDPHG